MLGADRRESLIRNGLYIAQIFAVALWLLVALVAAFAFSWWMFPLMFFAHVLGALWRDLYNLEHGRFGPLVRRGEEKEAV